MLISRNRYFCKIVDDSSMTACIQVKCSLEIITFKLYYTEWTIGHLLWSPLQPARHQGQIISCYQVLLWYIRAVRSPSSQKVFTQSSADGERTREYIQKRTGTWERVLVLEYLISKASDFNDPNAGVEKQLHCGKKTRSIHCFSILLIASYPFEYSVKTRQISSSRHNIFREIYNERFQARTSHKLGKIDVGEA